MPDSLSNTEIAVLLIRFSIESALLASAVWFAWTKLGVSRVFAKLPGFSRLACLTLFGALMIVQLIDRWQYHMPTRASFYPLTRFAMYQVGKPQAKILSWRLEREQSGKWHEVNLPVELSAVGLPSISTRCRIIAERFLSESAEDQKWAESQVQGYAVALAHDQNAKFRFVVEQWEPEGKEHVDAHEYELLIAAGEPHK